MNAETVLRKQAIELYLQGDTFVTIGDKLGRSRQWVHKWVNRYKAGGGDWFNSVSNAPKKFARAIPQEVERAIVSIRQNLNGQRYAQKGALSILYEFERLNIHPPSISTINRVIKRHDLIAMGTIKSAKKKSTLIAFPTYSRWIS